jgi:Lon protease-like protein
MKLPLFPLHTVLFPGMPLPLHIFEPRYQAMIETCLNHQAPFGVVLIRTGPEVGGPAEPHAIGTSASISRVERLPDGRMNIEAVGQERIKILALQHDEAYLTGTVENYPLDGAEDLPAHRSARALAPWLGRYLTLLGEAAGAPFDKKHLPNNPASLAYLAAIVVQIPLEEKQRLLNLPTAVELLDHERTIYRREVSLVRAILNNGQADADNSFSPN